MKGKVGEQWNKIFMKIFRSILHGFFACFSGVVDWIVLILVWFERSLHSAQVSGQSRPWSLKLMTSQGVERTWIRGAVTGRSGANGLSSRREFRDTTRVALNNWNRGMVGGKKDLKHTAEPDRQKLDSAFHLKNWYSMDEYHENQLCAILWIVIYPLDSTFYPFDRNWDQISFCITAKVLLTVFIRLTAQERLLIFGPWEWALVRGERLFEAGRLLNFHHFQQV